MSIKHLHHDSFHSKPNESVSRVNYLDLDFNYISVLHDDQFVQLTYLKELTMKSNRLTVISSRIFSNNKRINRIDLSGNNIVNFD